VPKVTDIAEAAIVNDIFEMAGRLSSLWSFNPWQGQSFCPIYGGFAPLTDYRLDGLEITKTAFLTGVKTAIRGIAFIFRLCTFIKEKLVVYTGGKMLPWKNFIRSPLTEI
jgi:hypothetical protein